MKFKILKYLKNNKKYYGLEIIAYDKNKAHEYIHPKYKILKIEKRERQVKKAKIDINKTYSYINNKM